MSLSTAYSAAMYGLWVLAPLVQVLLIYVMVLRRLRQEAAEDPCGRPTAAERLVNGPR